MPVDIFFSYAHEDEQLMDEVRRQLVIFERQGKIIKWHDRQIPPGAEWEAQIDERLRTAHVVLLFVSPAFLESRYCYDVEVVAALERHKRGEARVIPIILRPCAWDVAPFANLQALPVDARPVTQWPDRDQVCLDIARSIIAVADQVVAGDRRQAPGTRTRSNRRLSEGDRIARIVVPFTPPKGINIPPGYQRRLNQISSDIALDSAVRSPTGGFQYPAQFRGEVAAVRDFADRVRASGGADSISVEETGESAEVWFEYVGGLSPRELKDMALASDLEVVHCGATLLVSMPTQHGHREPS